MGIACVSERKNIIIRTDRLKENKAWGSFGGTVCSGSGMKAIRDELLNVFVSVLLPFLSLINTCRQCGQENYCTWECNECRCWRVILESRGRCSHRLVLGTEC